MSQQWLFLSLFARVCLELEKNIAMGQKSSQAKQGIRFISFERTKHDLFCYYHKIIIGYKAKVKSRTALTAEQSTND